jgi:hypothetical protein
MGPMPQGDRTRPRAAAIAAALVGSALLAASISPATAPAKVPKGAVKKLRSSKCPPRYAVRVARTPSPDELRAAKRGRFEIAGVDVHIKRNMDWTYDPLDSATFRGRLHDLRWLDTLLYAYRTRGDRRALTRAKRIVVDWVEANPRRRPTTDRTWFDKVVGDRAPYIAYVVRAAECEGMIGNQNLARKLLGSVDQHADFLRKPSNYSQTNRGLFMDLGLIFSGRQVRFLPGANRSRRQGQRRFVQTVDKLTEFGEGLWLEHSTTYQLLVVNVLGRFLEIDKQDRPALEELLVRMREVAAWMTMPDDRWLQAGDSYQDRSDAETRRAARRQRGLHVLPKSGMAFVKKKEANLALLSNFHGATHKHSDDLSFDLFDAGHRIVSDTGIPDKDFGTPYLFAISPEAHSVVTVDGDDFPREKAAAYGSGIVAAGSGDGWFGIEATNPLVRDQGVDHNRLLLYRPGYALIVADRMRAPQGHTYRSHFQFGPDYGLVTEPDRLELRAGADRVTVFNESTDTSPGRRVARGETDPLEGFVYPAFRDRDARWTETFTAEGDDVDNVTTIALNPKRTARAAAFGPLGPASSFAITEEGALVKTLTVRREGDQLVIEQLESAGPEAPAR